MCQWNTEIDYCDDAVKACRASAPTSCQQLAKCMWRTGVETNEIAVAFGVNAQLVNPGQSEIFVFPKLVVEGEEIVSGATIVIETNYQRGKDLLELTYPTTIQTQWIQQSGTLRLRRSEQRR